MVLRVTVTQVVQGDPTLPGRTASWLLLLLLLLLAGLLRLFVLRLLGFSPAWTATRVFC